MIDNDFTAINFAVWTDINLSSSIDFLQSILAKHGNLSGDYASLSDVIEALKQGQKYATEYRAYMNKETIYAVTEGFHEDTVIKAAFSTRELADEWIKKEAIRRRDIYIDFYHPTCPKSIEQFKEWFRVNKISFVKELS